MKFAAWNLHHQAQRRRIPSSIEAAIAGLEVDVLVLNEFVDGPGRGWFRACLDRVGLGNQVLSHTTARHNQILIAAREPIFVGDLQAPTFDGSARSNFLHVVLGSGLELVGLRVPAYEPAADLLAYNAQLAEVLGTIGERRLIVTGDFNLDPFGGALPDKISTAKWATCPSLIAENPAGPWSYVNYAGTCTSRIDHVAHTPSVAVTDATYITHAGNVLLAGPGNESPISDHAALIFSAGLAPHGRAILSTVSPTAPASTRLPEAR